MFKKSLFYCFMLICFATTAVAQSSSMTDEQVIEYVKTATENGKSQKQIITELASKGVTREQMNRIKKEREEIISEKNKISATEKNRERNNPVKQEEMLSEEMDAITAELNKPTEQTTEEAAKMVFGRNIFRSKNLTFAPNQNLATPINYKLGPGDEVIIDIWGASQNTMRETISPDGYIKVENIGLIYLNGMTIKEADSYLRKAHRMAM